MLKKLFIKYKHLLFILIVLFSVLAYPPVTHAAEYYDLPQQVQTTGPGGYSAYEQTRVGDTIYQNQYYGDQPTYDPVF